MRFRDAKAESDWNGLGIHPLLRKVVFEVAVYALSAHKWDILWTCFQRTAEENDALYGGHGDHLTGVHVVVPCRGGDGRTQGIDPSVVQDVVVWTNRRWCYDRLRPSMQVALFEGDAPGAGSSASHLHLQVYPSTALRAYTVED